MVRCVVRREWAARAVGCGPMYKRIGGKVGDWRLEIGFWSPRARKRHPPSGGPKAEKPRGPHVTWAFVINFQLPFIGAARARVRFHVVIYLASAVGSQEAKSPLSLLMDVEGARSRSKKKRYNRKPLRLVFGLVFAYSINRCVVVQYFTYCE